MKLIASLQQHWLDKGYQMKTTGYFNAFSAQGTSTDHLLNMCREWNEADKMGLADSSGDFFRHNLI